MIVDPRRKGLDRAQHLEQPAHHGGWLSVPVAPIAPGGQGHAEVDRHTLCGEAQAGLQRCQALGSTSCQVKNKNQV